MAVASRNKANTDTLNVAYDIASRVGLPVVLLGKEGRIEILKGMLEKHDLVLIGMKSKSGFAALEIQRRDRRVHPQIIEKCGRVFLPLGKVTNGVDGLLRPYFTSEIGVGLDGALKAFGKVLRKRGG